ncbi:hypothetical protein CJ010_14135 [Azoarcus sp. DD4]|uniref:ankyrin repeat domain-containing protein n=1 Tax=Azoarcus sp. DD4 TaxID=2027405 RepID=UPI0011261E49|nr:ankyrin repeat domain-containing protein [Azoarcus sp. DD4]QDF97594.1 hypothetical protein CJ010_14135 [Azoarcus sp. DD4]
MAIEALIRSAVLGVALAAGYVGSSHAQVPPSAAEQAAYTGLHAAAWLGDTARVAALVAKGIDIEARDGRGRTPLHVAAHGRRREVIALLAKAGADLNALEYDRYDAVTIAAVADDEATLAQLLALGASARQVTSRYDGTALIAAAHLGHDGVVRQLIAAGAPLDHVNNLHWTALIEAVVLGDGGARHVATVKALLDAGADRRLTDRSGVTPLEMARRRGYREMVDLLQAPAPAR